MLLLLDVDQHAVAGGGGDTAGGQVFWTFSSIIA